MKKIGIWTLILVFLSSCGGDLSKQGNQNQDQEIIGAEISESNGENIGGGGAPETQTGDRDN